MLVRATVTFATALLDLVHRHEAWNQLRGSNGQATQETEKDHNHRHKQTSAPQHQTPTPRPVAKVEQNDHKDKAHARTGRQRPRKEKNISMLIKAQSSADDTENQTHHESAQVLRQKLCDCVTQNSSDQASSAPASLNTAPRRTSPGRSNRFKYFVYTLARRLVVDGHIHPDLRRITKIGQQHGVLALGGDALHLDCAWSGRYRLAAQSCTRSRRPSRRRR